MPIPAAAIIAPIAAAGLSAGIGALSGKAADKRQFKQQEKMQGLQVEGQKELTKFNQEQSLAMWHNTNYRSQLAELQSAGLNPGLMYGSAGQGGSTQVTPGNVTGGQAQRWDIADKAGMGLQVGMQAQMMQKQIELIDAQAKKTQAETEKLSGIDTAEAGTRIQEAGTRMENLAQQTQNAKLQADIMAYDKEIKAIETRIKEGTEQEVIVQAKHANDKLFGEAKSAMLKGEIDQATYDDIVKQTQQTTVEQQLRMGAIKAGIIKTGAETDATRQGINKMAAEILNMSETQRKQWREWEQGEKERWIREKQLELQKQGIEFSTGFGAEVARWAHILTGVINAIE